MVIPALRLGWVTAAALAFVAVVASAAHAETRGVDIRVLNTAGKSLASFRQYTGTVQLKTDPQATCFGQGTGGSGDRVRIDGSTALAPFATRWGASLR